MENVTDRTITERSQELTDSIRRCCDTPITNTSTAFHKSTSRWRIMSSPVSTVVSPHPAPGGPSALHTETHLLPAMRAPRLPPVGEAHAHLISCSSIHRPHTHRLHLSPLPGYYCRRCRLWIAANCEVESNHILHDQSAVCMRHFLNPHAKKKKN